MKKLVVILSFVFLMGCSSSPSISTTATSGILQKPSPVPTQTAIPPTSTLIPTATFTPTLIPTAVGGGAGKIAFTSERDGVSEIYVINSDGSHPVKLTNGITPQSDPAWSP